MRNYGLGTFAKDAIKDDQDAATTRRVNMCFSYRLIKSA